MTDRWQTLPSLTNHFQRTTLLTLSCPLQTLFATHTWTITLNELRLLKFITKELYPLLKPWLSVFLLHEIFYQDDVEGLVEACEGKGWFMITKILQKTFSEHWDNLESTLQQSQRSQPQQSLINKAMSRYAHVVSLSLILFSFSFVIRVNILPPYLSSLL